MNIWPLIGQHSIKIINVSTIKWKLIACLNGEGLKSKVMVVGGDSFC